MNKLLHALANLTSSASGTNRRSRRVPASRRHPRRWRPALETLESRALPTAYTAATAADLIADINAANKQGGANAITLAAPMASPYVLSAVNNGTDGANGLPVIGGNKADNLTILGNGDTIERSTAAGTPAFRLFDVASGGSLTLQNVTLQNGVAQGSGAAADGGAIHNQGSLTLRTATLQDNTAVGANGADGLRTQKKSESTAINGQAGADAAGGAVWSSGSVSLEGATVLYQNQAIGGKGGAGGVFSSVVDVAGSGGAGGGAFGGGLYLAGGNVNGAAATLIDNTAASGAGGDAFVDYGGGGVNWAGTITVGGLGGVGAGGALYAAAGTLNVTGATAQSNQAVGGTGGGATLFFEIAGSGGAAYGGGIDIAGGTATLATSGLVSNVAQGGTGGSGYNQDGGSGGNAFGGGLYAGASTVALTNDTATGNDAVAGKIGPYVGADDPTNGIYPPGPLPGTAAGGGIEIASAATVSIDSSTVNNSINNQIFTGPAYVWVTSNIDGKYTLLN